MTPYLLLMQACGLSQREAAELRNVRVDTVKSWCTGRNNAPQAAVDQLRDLYGRLVETAGNAVEAIEAMAGDSPVEIGYPADDHEARALGMPCVGAWRAMAAMVVAEMHCPVRLVPRGSTPSTAAAMDAAGR
jgi:hypothetical protein